MSDRTIDILAIGGIDLDLVLTVPHMPGLDEKALGSLVGRLPGGPVANFACAASQLGLTVYSYSHVGDDEGGQMIIDEFKQYRVDTTLMEVHPGKETPFTVILIDPTGEKVIIVVPTFEAEYLPEVMAEVLPQTQILYMLPRDVDAFLAIARLAHQHGTQIMIDVEPTTCSQRDKLERILSETDIASFNQFGFRAAAGQEPSIDAARELLQYGPHTIIVTRGSRGSLAVTETEASMHPGYKVSVADTTGAGDTFHAAFLAATLRGDSLAERLRFANATSALSVTALGPRGLLPTRDEVETFLAQIEENT